MDSNEESLYTIEIEGSSGVLLRSGLMIVLIDLA
jgi:hypothetical protein